MATIISPEKIHEKSSDEPVDSLKEMMEEAWATTEMEIAMTSLPPVPPTSDPERLLSYVMDILPKYTKMELHSTHLRLYSATLEQDMEQFKSQVRILVRELDGERERKQFLERYAAQVVKERNDLLHNSSSKSRNKTNKSSSHYIWHHCCRKNDSSVNTLDLTPSIATFRGEKLQQLTQQVTNLQEEMRKQEVLRQDLNLLMKKTQRDHDVEMAGMRKQLILLESQLKQRSILQSSMSRQLKEAQEKLSSYDQVKQKEIQQLELELETATRRVTLLETDLQSTQVKLEDFQHQTHRLQDELKDVTIQNELLSNRIEEMTIKYTAASSEIESLKSEIELLSNQDLMALKKMYMNKIDQMQKTQHLKDQAFQQEIDRLKAIATTKAAIEAKATTESTIRMETQDQKNVKEEEEEEEADKIGELLSRSQLSSSHISSASQVKYFDWESLLPDTPISRSIVSKTSAPTVQIEPQESDLSIALQGLELQDLPVLLDDSRSEEIIEDRVPIPDALRKSFEKEEQSVTFGSCSDEFGSTDTGRIEPQEEEEPEDLFMINLKEFLHGFEQKRQEEEAKALQVQSALAAFEKHLSTKKTIL